MKQIDEERSPLFSLNASEFACLTQAVALNLLHASFEVRHEVKIGVIVRFRSFDEAERVRALIA